MQPATSKVPCSTRNPKAPKSRNDDHLIQLSTGKSNLGLVTNKRLSVVQFRNRLAEPLLDSAISFAEYQKLSPDERAERKKVAGFIMAATFKDGKRKSANQENRTFLTYDMDFITIEQLETLRSGMAPICAYHWMMHTTRSHCPEKPRIRIFVFLTRPVNPEEYYALTRLVACKLADTDAEGIEIPDPVSFKYNQLMYWPSISRGQEYWFDENKATILDVDEFLAKHPTWTDISTIPKQAKAKDGRLADPTAKMEDPRNKKGWIGAFCRAYNIEDAIEMYLSDVYGTANSETETRYSYLLGTGSNGCIVYDDGLFMTSHHGSDPAEGTHNAWDLVRIHLFGHLDAKVREDAGPTGRPSHAAMVEMVSQDERALVEFGGPDFDDDDEDDAGYDADDEDQAPEFDDDEDEADDPDLADLIGTSKKPSKEKAEKPKADKKWMAQLRRKANGQLEPVMHNAVLICANDPRIAPNIGYNELTQSLVIFAPIRAKQVLSGSPKLRAGRNYRFWDDHDDLAVKTLFSAPAAAKGWEFDPPMEVIRGALAVAAKNNSFHPIRDLITKHHAAWIAAGRPRGLISQFAQHYLGCPDDAFHRESGRMLFIGLVARTFEPGCKFDPVTVIVGGQGSRKTEVWKTLAMHPDYHENLPPDFHRLDRMIEAMKGRLIVEMAEMVGFDKTSSAVIKEFVTKEKDTFRLAYARNEQTFYRSAIFGATQNNKDFLSDPTGNRRYWVWQDTHGEGTGKTIDIDGMAASVPLLYGEAYQEYLDWRERQPKGPLHLDLHSEEAIAGRNAINASVRVLTKLEQLAERIEEWLETEISAREIEGLGADMFDADESDNWLLRNCLPTAEIAAALTQDPLARNIGVSITIQNVANAMAFLKGWESCRAYRDGRQSRMWRRVGSDDSAYTALKDITPATKLI